MLIGIEKQIATQTKDNYIKNWSTLARNNYIKSTFLYFNCIQTISILYPCHIHTISIHIQKLFYKISIF